MRIVILYIKTGLYHRLAKYQLPTPEKMFDIHFFRENPRPFYDLARSLLPSNFTPTPMHFFMKLLEKKGILRRVYSQNIDTLERQAGIDPGLLVEAHGSFGSAHCVSCGAAYSMEYFRDKVMDMTDGIRGPKDVFADTSMDSQSGNYLIEQLIILCVLLL